MKIRITAAVAIAAVALVGLTGCGASYDETIAACRKEMTERPDDATGRPKVCEDVTDDDYGKIIIVVRGEKNGWFDENGDVDMGEMMKDGAED